MYYTISDVAERVNMSVSTLRYYDYQGILSFVKKNANGYRLFTEDDISDILMIKELKDVGIPLKSIREFCDIYRESGKSVQVQKKFLYAYEQSLLQKIKEDLDNLQHLQERIRTLDVGDCPLSETTSPVPETEKSKNFSHIL